MSGRHVQYVMICGTRHVYYTHCNMRPWWPAVICAIVKSGISFTNIYVKCAMLWVVDAHAHGGSWPASVGSQRELHPLAPPLHSVNCTPCTVWIAPPCTAWIAPPGKCCLLVSRTHCLFVPPLVLWRHCSLLFSFVCFSTVATQLMGRNVHSIFPAIQSFYGDIIICRKVIQKCN